jgi:sugar transferase (PEP-CTERM/EpsH1 system associated)
MPIRILHVMDSLGKGGLENGVVNLINRMDPVRFEHTVLTMRSLGPNAGLLPARVRIECCGQQKKSRFQVADLVQAIRRLEPDVVHSRNWPAIEAVIAGRWVGGCAVVHSEHGLDSTARSKEPWRRVCFRRLAFGLAHGVLSVSHQLRDVHSRGTGFPAHRIEVVHNGVDTTRFAGDAAIRGRVRHELGIAEGEFCLGTVGSLFPIKDHMTLLKAIARAATRLNNWRLLMIGEGPELTRLRTFVEGHPAWRSRVSFLGVSDRVGEMLNAMDAYVLPSISEGISNSLLEAMASGLAVIATATGGNPEVVVDGESGLLFPVGDSERLARLMVSLKERPELRTHLGEKARRRVSDEFSIDSMVRKYEGIYAGLAALAAGAPAVTVARA